MKKNETAADKLDRTILDDFNFFHISELTEEEKKPPDFIVEGIIPVGLTFLSGSPKTRKSFLALQLTAAVATGTPFLGHKTNQCEVAYFDLEGSTSRISSRIEKMEIELPNTAFFANSLEAKVSDGLAEKLKVLHQKKPNMKLIIIDTYSHARGTIKATGANAYDTDVQILEPIQKMAMNEKIAVVFVHHDKKGASLNNDSLEKLSGTMGISGSCDSVLNLITEGKRFEGKATLEYNPKDAKGGEIKILFNDFNLTWTEEKQTPQVMEKNPIISFLLQSPPDNGRVGDFYLYQDIYFKAYKNRSDNAANEIRDIAKKYNDELLQRYGSVIQVGSRDKNGRGIRFIKVI